jgi:hypothetical protein
MAVRQDQQEQQAQPPQVVEVHLGLEIQAQVLMVRSSSQYSQHKEKSCHTNVY